MDFGYQFKKYDSTRNIVYGKSMVATSHPLAAQAGLDIIKKGGNAVDAAIATAAMLTVVEPTSNGFGGDAFALVWIKDKLHGLNSSGFAPKAISSKELVDKGYTEMPEYGFIPVTVPGIPGAWAELSKKYGKLDFKELLKPAIDTARNGHAVAPTVAKYWKEGIEGYKTKTKGGEFDEIYRVFAPTGSTPKAGEIWKSEDHARTLEILAETKCEAFYRGELAEKIDECSRRFGGYIRKEDLAEFYPEWVEPISMDYKGYEVCEIPPNGHGITALMALNILKNIEIKEKESVDTYHKLMECMKLAFVDTREFVADPRFMEYTVQELLSPEYGKQRASLIGDKAIEPAFGTPQKGGTVYLCTADGEGNMVSYIQSNYMGFGSGVVVPGTGIALHNRGNNFNLRQGHPNCIEGGKKPYHTIIPGFLKKEGKAVGPFGVMGGFMQPQGHLQVITNTIDFGLNPQDSLDAPRWQWVGGMNYLIEPEMPTNITRELIEKGHNVIVATDRHLFGRGQIIWRDENGVLCGGTESRCDGYIAVM